MPWRSSGRLRRANLLSLAAVTSVTGFFDHGFHDFGVAFHRNHDGVLFHTIGAAGNDRQYLPSIRHRQPGGKCSVGAKLNGITSQGDACVGFGPTENDHFGVHFKLEFVATIEDLVGADSVPAS